MFLKHEQQDDLRQIHGILRTPRPKGKVFVQMRANHHQRIMSGECAVAFWLHILKG
jgi:hypothetical protein